MHQERPRIPPPLNFPPPLGQTPPVTVLVPYPVVLPIPIPIPIPMPLTSFIQAHCSKVKTEAKSDDNEGPLDFTMNSDKKKDETNGVDRELETDTPENDACEPNGDVNERIEEEDKTEGEATESANPEQTLPKFKITRLGNKMAKIVAKPREQPESTRPLRKRRRLVEVATDDDALIPKTRKIVEV